MGDDDKLSILQGKVITKTVCGNMMENCLDFVGFPTLKISISLNSLQIAKGPIHRWTASYDKDQHVVPKERSRLPLAIDTE